MFDTIGGQLREIMAEPQPLILQFCGENADHGGTKHFVLDMFQDYVRNFLCNVTKPHCTNPTYVTTKISLRKKPRKYENFT